MNERSAAAAEPSANRPDRRPAAAARPCSHCSGSGREPAPLALEFSRAGHRRGELTSLAARAGCPVSTVSRILGGVVVPTVENVVLIAEALGVTETALIRYPPIWHRVLQELGD